MPTSPLLPPGWNVPQKFRDRLGDVVGRQRVMLHEGHLLLVLHHPPVADDVRRQGRFFWRKPDGSWSSDVFGGGPQALARHLDEYAEVIGTLDRQEDTAAGSEDYFAVLHRLAPVYRAARNMHLAFQQAREMCPDDRDLINLRDRAYELERTAELLYGDAQSALDFAVARRSEEQAKSARRMAVAAHRLNLLAAFFFPIATLTAIFGVNLQHGLETASPPIPFLSVLAAGLLIGAGLTVLITRQRRAESRELRVES